MLSKEMKDFYKKQLAKKFIAAVFLAIFLAGCPAAFVLAEGMTLQEAAAKMTGDSPGRKSRHFGQ